MTADPARPLVVRLRNWVGDVVLGLPALQLLQSHGFALQLVARGKWAPSLLAGSDWPVHVQPAAMTAKVAQLRRLRADCKRLDARFDRRDNTLLLPVSLSSAIEARLAGLRAVGFAKEGRTPLLARGVPVVHDGHEMTRYWRLACRFLDIDAAPPGHITLPVSPAAAITAVALLRAHGVTGRFVMACPFAGGRSANPGKPVKTWPGFPRFVELAANDLGLPVLLYPGPGEHAQARAQFPAAQVVEGADLAVYAALLQRAALVVANDTGPGHMAAAVGVPVVSVLGPTTAARWAPYGPNVTVLQRPPHADGSIDWPSADDGLQAARLHLRS